MVDKKIIRICCEEIEELVEEGGEEHSEGAHLGVEGLKDLKTEALEKKLEKMMWLSCGCCVWSSFQIYDDLM